MIKASELKSYKIEATDGSIGSVVDLLFDDERWVIRWLVVDVGGILSRQDVLLPTSHLGRVNRAAANVRVELTREQVKGSPDAESHRPVSRQIESSLYGHYGWTPYWGGIAATGAGAGYLIPPRYLPKGTSRPPNASPPQATRGEDPHLRSAKEVTGYRLEASDGEIGHVEDFLFNDSDWTIRYLIVDTKNWWPGKFVLIAPDWAEEIGWSERIVRVTRSRQEIKNAPEFDPKALFERAHESRLYEHYGLPGYWV